MSRHAKSNQETWKNLETGDGKSILESECPFELNGDQPYVWRSRSIFPQDFLAWGILQPHQQPFEDLCKAQLSLSLLSLRYPPLSLLPHLGSK